VPKVTAAQQWRDKRVKGLAIAMMTTAVVFHALVIVFLAPVGLIIIIVTGIG
jgi:hypothetical protein